MRTVHRSLIQKHKFDPAVRFTALFGVIGGDGLARAIALSREVFRVHAPLHQGPHHRHCTIFGERIVEPIRALAIGMARDFHFEIGAIPHHFGQSIKHLPAAFGNHRGARLEVDLRAGQRPVQHRGAFRARGQAEDRIEALVIADIEIHTGPLAQPIREDPRDHIGGLRIAGNPVHSDQFRRDDSLALCKLRQCLNRGE